MQVLDHTTSGHLQCTVPDNLIVLFLSRASCCRDISCCRYKTLIELAISSSEVLRLPRKSLQVIEVYALLLLPFLSNRNQFLAVTVCFSEKTLIQNRGRMTRLHCRVLVGLGRLVAVILNDYGTSLLHIQASSYFRGESNMPNSFTVLAKGPPRHHSTENLIQLLSLRNE